jgi:hypothetical protein
MTKLDPRRYAFRPDLAAASLQGQVRAPAYSTGEVRQVSAPQTPLRAAPRFDAPLVTEALSGELVTVYEQKEGWGWVQLNGDGYVGYTPMDGLTTLPEEPTHKVAARLTYVYPTPDMKLPPFMRLSFSSLVTISGSEGRFWQLSRGGYIFGDHLVGVDERARDFVRVAERFVGAPYLWGGKTATGIDCSGLVQLSLQAAGFPCPRDSDMQLDEVGEAVDTANLDAIQRGDLLFWKGHVAVAQSADWMVHASGAHMEVVVEPVRRAIERIAESHGPLLAIKRPSVEQAAMRPVLEAAKAQAAAELAKVLPSHTAGTDQPAPKDARQAPPKQAKPVPPGPSTRQKSGQSVPQPAAGETPSAPVPPQPAEQPPQGTVNAPRAEPAATAAPEAAIPADPKPRAQDGAEPSPPAKPSPAASAPPDNPANRQTADRAQPAPRSLWRGFSRHGDQSGASKPEATQPGLQEPAQPPQEVPGKTN